jgi:hypothetical protein
MLVLDDEVPQAVPHQSKEAELDMPKDCHSALEPILQQYKTLFRTELGQTGVTEHVIETGSLQTVRFPHVLSHSTTQIVSTTGFGKWRAQE